MRRKTCRVLRHAFPFARNRALVTLLITLHASMAASARAGAQPVTTSDTSTRRLRAVRVSTPPLVDGRLTEAAWAEAPVTGAWWQVFPEEGVVSAVRTEVRVLQDDAHLYVGVRARRAPGASPRPRSRNLQRDFLYPEHDAVAIMFDPFRDGRGSWIFGVAARGNIEDRAFTAGVGADADWDAPWRARTAVNDSGWTAELAIPWSVIPALAADSMWGFNALRVERSRNETSMWSPVPRGSVVLRSEFFGLLEGVRPRRTGVGLQIQPYLLGRRAGGVSARGEQDNTTIGGELKWRPTRSVVADLTLNTDFAQADVDRQVVNLTRFSVFFPERRPFFQEGRLLFSTGIYDRIQPVFTRRIGLDEQGRAVPITAGARVLQRSSGGQAGVLLVRQGSDGTYRSSDFGVGRITRNVGKRSRLGAMVATRHDSRGVEGTASPAASREHATAAIDGFTQLTPLISVDGGASYTWLAPGADASDSSRRALGVGNGLAAHIRAQHQGPVLGSVATLEGAQAGYRPLVGFLGRTDYLRATWGGEWDVRPRQRPAWMRRVVPGFETSVVWSASTRELEEARLVATPLVVEWHNGTRLRLGAETERQVLQRPFSPLPDVRVPTGRTTAWRAVAFAGTDASRSLAARADITSGGYFDGRATTVTSQLAWTPDPRFAFSLRYAVAAVRGVGATADSPRGSDVTTQLFSPELRLAWSPRCS